MDQTEEIKYMRKWLPVVMYPESCSLPTLVCIIVCGTFVKWSVAMFVSF